jgi:hypothetical protein
VDPRVALDYKERRKSVPCTGIGTSVQPSRSLVTMLGLLIGKVTRIDVLINTSLYQKRPMIVLGRLTFRILSGTLTVFSNADCSWFYSTSPHKC